MYPHERSLVKHLAGKPFALIGVNSDQTVSIPQKLAKEGVVTWRSFQNDGPDTPISKSWGVRGWPTIYLLDAEGVIRHHNVRGKKLDEALEELLAEINVEFPVEAIHATTAEEAAKDKARKKAAQEKAKAEKEKADAAKAKAEKEKADAGKDGELEAPESDG